MISFNHTERSFYAKHVFDLGIMMIMIRKDIFGLSTFYSFEI